MVKSIFIFRLKPVEMFAYFFNGLKPVSIDIPYSRSLKYMGCTCCSGKTYEDFTGNDLGYKTFIEKQKVY